MTPEQFCYWLQGFSELTESTPSEAQWKSIKEHLATVYHKVTNPVFYPQIPQPSQPLWLDSQVSPKFDPLKPIC